MTAFTALNGGDSRSLAGHKDTPPKVDTNIQQYRRSGAAQPVGDGQYLQDREVVFDSPVKRKRSVSPEAAGNEGYRRSHPRGEPRTVHLNERQREDESRGYQKTWYAGQPHDEEPHHIRQHDTAFPSTSRRDEREQEAVEEGDTIHVEDPDCQVSSPEEDDSMMPFNGKHDQSPNDTVVQSNPSKRKRNFSHRTKTGCHTCRRRKKKCDELKPECVNCQRGGFVCTGYTSTTSRDYKAETKPAAVPLESKDPTYVPPGAYGMPQQTAGYAFQVAPPTKRNSLPGYRGPTLQTDFPSNRPAPVLDERPASASTLATTSVHSSDGKIKALSTFAQATNAYATPDSAISKNSLLKTPSSSKTPTSATEFPRTTLHEPPRSDPRTPHPDVPHSEPQFSRDLPRLSALGHNGHLGVPTTQHYSPPALNMNHAIQARPRTQKEEMLAGKRYNPTDQELTLERQRCAAALWRFNNALSPVSGISDLERSRLLSEILDPKETVNLSPHQLSPVINRGRMGADVVVEGPFTCDYGYNIKLGNNVFIGKNCTIMDPCEISIGNDCYISPNVSIYGSSLAVNPSDRHGGRRAQTGKPVFIEEDVWIGGGAIILPGRRVGRGATVGAGAVVTRDVPPYTVCVGNPGRIIRSTAERSTDEYPRSMQ